MRERSRRDMEEPGTRVKAGSAEIEGTVENSAEKENRIIRKKIG